MTSTPAFTEADFRKASASRPDLECVAVARRGGWVEVRDDKTTFGSPADHRLVFTDTEFDAVLAGLRAGDTTGLPLQITRRPDGTHTFRHATAPGPHLEFTAAEVTAFLTGVRAGEFDTIAYAA
uniref:DUF397 domain-containing protein n=1 Tax=Pseudonocardia sp. CA-138482 TaxID=3240023 RepID=UPI003F490C2F